MSGVRQSKITKWTVLAGLGEKRLKTYLLLLMMMLLCKAVIINDAVSSVLFSKLLCFKGKRAEKERRLKFD